MRCRYMNGGRLLPSSPPSVPAVLVVTWNPGSFDGECARWLVDTSAAGSDADELFWPRAAAGDPGRGPPPARDGAPVAKVLMALICGGGGGSTGIELDASAAAFVGPMGRVGEPGEAWGRLKVL